MIFQRFDDTKINEQMKAADEKLYSAFISRSVSDDGDHRCRVWITAMSRWDAKNQCAMEIKDLYRINELIQE